MLDATDSVRHTVEHLTIGQFLFAQAERTVIRADNSQLIEPEALPQIGLVMFVA